MRHKGIASITEAMIVSIMIAIVVALSFTFFTNYYRAMTPKIEYKDVDVVLCGNVLTLKNVGETPVKIEGVWGIYYEIGRTGINVRSDWINLNYLLQPGDIKNVALTNTYSYVIVKTTDVRLNPVKNSCVEKIETGGVGGIR